MVFQYASIYSCRMMCRLSYPCARPARSAGVSRTRPTRLADHPLLDQESVAWGVKAKHADSITCP
jgi:hypothetical protein